MAIGPEKVLVVLYQKLCDAQDELQVLVEHQGSPQLRLAAAVISDDVDALLAEASEQEAFLLKSLELLWDYESRVLTVLEEVERLTSDFNGAPGQAVLRPPTLENLFFLTKH